MTFPSPSRLPPTTALLPWPSPPEPLFRLNQAATCHPDMALFLQEFEILPTDFIVTGHWTVLYIRLIFSGIIFGKEKTL